MDNTTLIKEYKEAGMKMLAGRDEMNCTNYYWKPEMGLAIAENDLGDIGIVYKTKETLPDNFGELLDYIEEYSEDGALSINIFDSIKETRAFIEILFQNLKGQQGEISS